MIQTRGRGGGGGAECESLSSRRRVSFGASALTKRLDVDQRPARRTWKKKHINTKQNKKSRVADGENDAAEFSNFGNVSGFFQTQMQPRNVKFRT